MGNLTITGHNSELGTKSFIDKKEIIKANSKAVILNRDVLSADTWNEETIVNRAKILSALLIKEFDYENIESDLVDNSKNVFTIDSGLNLTNSKPNGFSFIGEYTKVNSWVEMLTKFMSIAYDLDTPFLTELANNNYVMPNAVNVYITNDKRKLRKEKEIERSGIYFETNLAANTIISFIKDLMINMNLEMDEFSFTLSEIPFDINDENTWEEGIIPVGKIIL